MLQNFVAVFIQITQKDLRILDIAGQFFYLKWVMRRDKNEGAIPRLIYEDTENF